MIRIHLFEQDSLENFADSFSIQLNDTHPSISVAELMRLLVDEYEIAWEKAWEITQKTLSYTNHTLLPEALEKWSLNLFGSLLPRHLEIIYEINRRFLDQVRLRYPADEHKIANLSLIDETGEKYVRMAHLACVGSHAINGVAALHSELLKETTLRDFYELFPQKFSNKTNGVTPRRWMVLSNPKLSQLITEKIGEGWVKNLYELKQLEDLVEDSNFRLQWQQIKREVKQDLARYIEQKNDLIVDPNSLFDVQVKRIHEYKRQHLNVLHIISLYLRIKNNPNLEVAPRTFIFGGKAAPGYFMAKLMIKFINAVAEVVNNDPVVGDRLKVVFLSDYNVKLGQRVYPAADLSEQISTAGKEASGTGNMKFSMNGALTIGTLDGANVEIREEVGKENFFLFGLTADEVQQKQKAGYRPWDYYQNNTELKTVINLINSGFFAHGDSDLFRPLTNSLLYGDPYFLLADYQSYVDCQEKVSQAYQNPEQWSKMSILNVARMGKFSSDRSIREYCQDIWNIQAVPIALLDLCPDGQCLLY
jgi:starch phosphorylase